MIISYPHTKQVLFCYTRRIKDENDITKPEDTIGDSAATEPDNDNEDAVKPQDSDKENSTTQSDTDKKANDAIPSENNADNSSTKSNDNGQPSVTLGILDISAISQNENCNLGVNNEGNKNFDTQMSESKNETILAE